MAPQAYLNRIATSVPQHDVHQFYLRYGALLLDDDAQRLAVFERMVALAGIEHRYSCFAPADDPRGGAIDRDGTSVKGSFASTAIRMEMYEAAAPQLAQQAVDKLLADEDRSLITHLIVTSCTGFSAPGIDLELVARCGLPNSVERTIVGFMGCYAAINALKLARHIVRSDPKARVLTVNIELCTLHFREATELEKLISFCLWGDGCAASLVTAEPHGILLESFHAIVAAERKELMSWHIRDDGFEMVLSGQVPGAVRETLRNEHAAILGGRPAKEIDLWAVHPGGRSVLDAVERALKLDPSALAVSREVLRQYGNMSSATVMFVMAEMLKEPAGLLGCGMAFGPGLTTETMMFRTA
ncbi:type III polyketide synthase [Mesorhizobium loti]|uniref:Type III polyketide synthase n=1 Tax=Mesorhizobium loti R88b TaxID=935548 RepID=A0A6M7WKF3_RHILI|nr:type III polyketide synthase [Mesorhizobium loti]QKD02547.1 type III polyketide synthase [Mesorhizobium loti R88b]